MVYVKRYFFCSIMTFICSSIQPHSNICLIACAEIDAYRKFEVHTRFGNAAYCIKTSMARSN